MDNKEDSVEEVLHVMTEHSISSVPILSANNEMIGCVDMVLAALHIQSSHRLSSIL